MTGSLAARAADPPDGSGVPLDDAAEDGVLILPDEVLDPTWPLPGWEEEATPDERESSARARLPDGEEDFVEAERPPWGDDEDMFEGDNELDGPDEEGM